MVIDRWFYNHFEFIIKFPVFSFFFLFKILTLNKKKIRIISKLISLTNQRSYIVYLFPNLITHKHPKFPLIQKNLQTLPIILPRICLKNSIIFCKALFATNYCIIGPNFVNENNLSRYSNCNQHLCKVLLKHTLNFYLQAHNTLKLSSKKTNSGEHFFTFLPLQLAKYLCSPLLENCKTLRIIY